MLCARAEPRFLKGGCAVALLLLGVVVPTAASAHQTGVSYLELWGAGSASIGGQLRISRAVLGGGSLGDMRLIEDTLGRVALTRGSSACAFARGQVRAGEGDDLIVSGSWTCPETSLTLRAQAGLLDRLSPGHVLLIGFDRPTSTELLTARSSAQVLEVSLELGIAETARRFVLLGVEHIFSGWDHLAFLLGLLMLGGTIRRFVSMVTSFSVAHSVTLALAATGVVTVPPRLVEPMIALSIVFVGVENLFLLRRQAGGGQRWRAGFAFGLVHGFGFAGVLNQLQLPPGASAVALMSFNFGVELGQLVILSAAWPILAALRRLPGFAPWGLRLGSTAIGCAGLYWFAERIVDSG